MAIEILAEFAVTVVGEVAGAMYLSKRIREWRLDAFLGGLSPELQRAFLEVVAAAILEDGKLSDDEKAWMDRRRGNAPDVVDAAIATATQVLPPRDRPEELKRFLEERAALFTDDEQRERALSAACLVLQAAATPDWKATAQLFGSALRVHTEKVTALLANLESGGAYAGMGLSVT